MKKQTISQVRKKYKKNFLGRLPLDNIFTQQDIGKYFIAGHWNPEYSWEEGSWLKLYRVTGCTEIKNEGFFRSGIVSYIPEELNIEIKK